jgi:hypothetical protein
LPNFYSSQPAFRTYRLAGIYTGKIRGAAKPADLPDLPPKFESVTALKPRHSA